METNKKLLRNLKICACLRRLNFFVMLLHIFILQALYPDGNIVVAMTVGYVLQCIGMMLVPSALAKLKKHIKVTSVFTTAKILMIVELVFIVVWGVAMASVPPLAVYVGLMGIAGFMMNLASPELESVLRTYSLALVDDCKWFESGVAIGYGVGIMIASLAFMLSPVYIVVVAVIFNVIALVGFVRSDVKFDNVTIINDNDKDETRKTRDLIPLLRANKMSCIIFGMMVFVIFLEDTISSTAFSVYFANGIMVFAIQNLIYVAMQIATNVLVVGKMKVTRIVAMGCLMYVLSYFTIFLSQHHVAWVAVSCLLVGIASPMFFSSILPLLDILSKGKCKSDELSYIKSWSISIAELMAAGVVTPFIAMGLILEVSIGLTIVAVIAIILMIYRNRNVDEVEILTQSAVD